MADRPILFSAPMIRALLDGRKTTTRRVIKPQPYDPGDPSIKAAHMGGATWKLGSLADMAVGDDWNVRFAPGDRLYARETWRSWRWNNDLKPAEMAERWGDDDARKYIGYEADDDQTRDGLHMDGKTRVSIHMPRWASRLTLIVSGVKVERLQDISEADALAEGVNFEPSVSEDAHRHWRDLGNDSKGADWLTGWDARDVYQQLWFVINGPGSWDANPWVVAPTFRVLKANIDAPEARAAA